MATQIVRPHSLFTDLDVYLLKSGKHYRLHEKLGSHFLEVDGVHGVYFAVWAPNASSVSVTGEFNEWRPDQHVLFLRLDETGIWEGFIPGIEVGSTYKYFIRTNKGFDLYKGDPYARLWEKPSDTASIVWQSNYLWKDTEWMGIRHYRNSLSAPYLVYELHLGSWLKPEERELSFYSYEDIAPKLVGYVKEMGFTHVELMPLMEHPYYPSWGYQIHGFFAPTARFGSPDGLKLLIDSFHQNGIGVIMDWVPSHFPADMHGLYRFDGTALYEHEDMRKGFHPEWNSYIFNYGRNEVRSFLISNAIYWLEEFHLDGLRVDAIASIIFLDYARDEGQWVPNIYGGNENLEAIQFLKDLNTEVYRSFPDVQMIAEDSTAFPKVSKPIYDGGLGFGMKWMMGWMNDTLKYFKLDPVHRKFHHEQITFSIIYVWSEQYMLPLSHDEVVHGKASLLLKMPGDDWQKFASLRVLYGYMYAHPGSKLLFMGAEIAQLREWNYTRSLDWDLLIHISHKGIQDWIKDLNHLYRVQPAFYENAYSESGFEWLVVGDYLQSVLVFLRKGKNEKDIILTIHNMTPIPRPGYRIGISTLSKWTLLLNSDELKYWGSNYEVFTELNSENHTSNGRAYSIVVNIPPMASLYYGITAPIKSLSSKTANKSKKFKVA
jgi:1,4-alpha-glucan branching enzyme